MIMLISIGNYELETGFVKAEDGAFQVIVKS